MFLSIVIVFGMVFLCFSSATPVENVNSGGGDNFRNKDVHRQDLHTVLGSIEERLRNFEQIYLSASFEEKLEHYQRKLESLDVKLIRLETLVMLNLDQMAENMSAKNAKDDTALTNLEKKIDALYDGFNHKLSYIERKLDVGTIKVQNKLETSVNRLEKMAANCETRDEYIGGEISDAIAAVDDLKTTCLMMEENIVNNTNENFEVALKEHAVIIQNYNNKINSFISKQSENITTAYKTINHTQQFLQELRHEIKTELNEYAVKVAGMNEANWQAHLVLENQHGQIQNQLNQTLQELVKNTFLANIFNRNLTVTDPDQMERLNEKIDANFEKVFALQHLFLDSCYRLQMDESQIESKISDILEKLMETFDEKTAIETKDIENLARIIKNHDSHTQRNLYQIHSNVISVHDKIRKDYKFFEMEFNRILEHLGRILRFNEQDKIDKQKFTTEIDNINSKIYLLNNHSLSIIKSIVELKQLFQKSTEIENAAEGIQVESTGGNNRIDELILEIFGTAPFQNMTKCNNTQTGLIDVRQNDDC